MISKEDAIQLVKKQIKKLESDEPFSIDIDGIEETAQEWIIGFNSKKYLQTKDIKYALIGNAPFIVNKETGEIRPTPSHDVPNLLLKSENNT